MKTKTITKTKNMESINEIGISISKHRKHELANYKQICAIGRANCDITSTAIPQYNGNHQFWLTNGENFSRKIEDNDGFLIYKNTRLGELLSKYHSGVRRYSVKSKAMVGMMSAWIYTTELHIL